MEPARKQVNEKSCRVLLVRDGKNDADWLRARQQNGIGASESPIICGMSPYGSIVGLYGEKLGLIDAGDESEAMRWGKLLEPMILQEYARERGGSVAGGIELLQSIESPFMLATPDAFQEREDRDDVGIVQIKLSSLSSEWKEGVPRRVWAQMQHEMYVTGCTWGTAVALLGGTKLVWADVEYEIDWEETMLRRCRDFWTCVLNREPIPSEWIDGTDATYEAIKAMFPERLRGETVELAGEFFDLHDRLQEMKGLVKNAQSEIDTIENQLRHAIGDKTFGRLPNGTTYSNKTQQRAGFTVAPTTFRVLRLMKGKAN